MVFLFCLFGICVFIFFFKLITGDTIYVDKGNPYTDHPLKVGELTITKTAQKSPLHTKGNLNFGDTNNKPTFQI